METIKEVIEVVRGKDVKELVMSVMIFVSLILLSGPISKFICKLY